MVEGQAWAWEWGWAMVRGIMDTRASAEVEWEEGDRCSCSRDALIVAWEVAWEAWVCRSWAEWRGDCCWERCSMGLIVTVAASGAAITAEGEVIGEEVEVATLVAEAEDLAVVTSVVGVEEGSEQIITY